MTLIKIISLSSASSDLLGEYKFHNKQASGPKVISKNAKQGPLKNWGKKFNARTHAYSYLSWEKNACTKQQF